MVWRDTPNCFAISVLPMPFLCSSKTSTVWSGVSCALRPALRGFGWLIFSIFASSRIHPNQMCQKFLLFAFGNRSASSIHPKSFSAITISWFWENVNKLKYWQLQEYQSCTNYILFQLFLSLILCVQLWVFLFWMWIPLFDSFDHNMLIYKI